MVVPLFGAAAVTLLAFVVWKDQGLGAGG